MRRRIAVVVVVAVLLPLRALPAAQAPTLASVLARLTVYLATYSEQYSATIANERYRQTSGRLSTAFFREVTLESDFGIVRTPGPGQWHGLRDVYRVDGREVQDRGDRLAKLLSEAFDPFRPQAKRIAQESARFNIGPVIRTINNPALVMKILDPANAYRLNFSKVDEDTLDGVPLWVIQFTEHFSPTLVQTSKGEDEPSEGRIWVDPVLGRLHRADITFRSTAPGMRFFRARLSVIFREDPRLSLWVPVRMTERYEGSSIDEVVGEATYSGYRRFGVDTREEFK
jgi:hypothetical protein